MKPRAAFFETLDGKGLRPYLINGPDRRRRAPTLDQAVESRITELYDVISSGAGSLAGKARRAEGRGGQEGQGEVVGRFRGVSHAYPELQKLGDRPQTVLSAIQRGRGKVYDRIRRAVRTEMEREEFKPAKTRRRGRLSIGPHDAITKRCRHCGQSHTTGEHRFHGAGSFNQTHLFSFGRRANPYLIVANPKQKGKSMAVIRMRRNRKGQFVARSSNPKKHHKRRHYRARASNPRRRRSRKRNYTIAGGAVPLMNRRHRRRHNPPSLPIPLLGTIDFPIDTIAGVTGGLIGPPIILGLATRTFPTYAAQYPMIFSIGSYAAPLFIGHMVAGRKGLRDVAIGEVAGFLVKQLTSLMAGTGLTLSGYVSNPAVAQRRLAGYTMPTTNRMLSGMGRGRHRSSGGRRLNGYPNNMNLAPGTVSRFQSRFQPS